MRLIKCTGNEISAHIICQYILYINLLFDIFLIYQQLLWLLPFLQLGSSV